MSSRLCGRKISTYWLALLPRAMVVSGHRLLLKVMSASVVMYRLEPTMMALACVATTVAWVLGHRLWPCSSLGAMLLPRPCQPQRPAPRLRGVVPAGVVQGLTNLGIPQHLPYLRPA